jgi:hypothetical protein
LEEEEMKKVKLLCVLLPALLLTLVFASSAQAVPFLDTFSDTALSEYTKTVILDQDASFEVSFASPSGGIQVSKSANTQAEQVLFMRDEDLAVGEILRIDKNAVKGTVYTDFGIAVSASLTDPPRDCLYFGYRFKPPKLHGCISEGVLRQHRIYRF